MDGKYFAWIQSLRDTHKETESSANENHGYEEGYPTNERSSARDAVTQQPSVSADHE